MYWSCWSFSICAAANGHINSRWNWANAIRGQGKWICCIGICRNQSRMTIRQNICTIWFVLWQIVWKPSSRWIWMQSQSANWCRQSRWYDRNCHHSRTLPTTMGCPNIRTNRLIYDTSKATIWQCWTAMRLQKLLIDFHHLNNLNNYCQYLFAKIKKEIVFCAFEKEFAFYFSRRSVEYPVEKKLFCLDSINFNGSSWTCSCYEICFETFDIGGDMVMENCHRGIRQVWNRDKKRNFNLLFYCHFSENSAHVNCRVACWKQIDNCVSLSIFNRSSEYNKHS